MKEQVITSRASNHRQASTGGGRASSQTIVQRPAKRGRQQAKGSSFKKVLAYLPLVGKILLATIVGLLVLEGYRAAASASFFQVRTVDVSGAERVSADDVKAVVRKEANASGVWKADLAHISQQIQQLPWVRRAVVTRVLPDGLRVRLTERAPVAVVRTSAGKLVWVDDEGVTLGSFSPSEQMPAFFIRGWDESSTELARTENRERVQKYLEMAREWNEAGLAERVSEVNLMDLRDVRAQLAGDDSAIEVRLGGKEFGKRLKSALKVLDEQRATRGASITHLDATVDKKVIVGLGSGAQTASETGDAANPTEASVVKTRATAREVKTPERGRETKRAASDRAERKQEKKEKKEKSADDAKSQTRPRRVG